MTREPTTRDYALLGVVLGGFIFVVTVGLASRNIDRTLGAVLLAVGIVAMLCAHRLSTAKAALGERFPLWPGRNTLRPFTVRLWGFAVAILGVFMIMGD